MSIYKKLYRKETLIDIALATFTAKYIDVYNVGIFIEKIKLFESDIAISLQSYPVCSCNLRLLAGFCSIKLSFFALQFIRAIGFTSLKVCFQVQDLIRFDNCGNTCIFHTSLVVQTCEQGAKSILSQSHSQFLRHNLIHVIADAQSVNVQSWYHKSVSIQSTACVYNIYYLQTQTLCNTCYLRIAREGVCQHYVFS